MKPDIVAAFSDGGVMGANPSKLGGSWAWCHIGYGNNLASMGDVMVASDCGLLIPRGKIVEVTNNYAEFVAAVRALRALPTGWEGPFYSDSEITLGRLFKGWATNGIPDRLQEMAQAVTARLGAVTPVLLAGHPTQPALLAGRTPDGRPVSKWNVWCDIACNNAMEQYRGLIERITEGKPVPPPAIPHHKATGATESHSKAR